MLLHITQIHTPETCPKDLGGSKVLYDPDVEGLKLLGIYGVFEETVIESAKAPVAMGKVHTIYLLE